MRYTKKRVTVDAWQFGSDVPVPPWLGQEFLAARISATPTKDGSDLVIGTLEGVMTAPKGHWIIKGVKGEIYPCAPDIFAETYEPEDEPA